MPNHCRYEYDFDNKHYKCKNESHGNNECILHFGDVNKSYDLFKIALEQEINHSKSNIIDLYGTVFPKNYNSIANLTFTKPTRFNNCIFHSNIIFSKIIFKEEVFFNDCTFNNKLIFQEYCIFQRKTEFKNVKLHSIGFTKFLQTKFQSLTIFGFETQKPITYEDCDFYGKVIYNNSNFTNSPLKYKNVKFHNKLLFEESNLNSVVEFDKTVFYNICDFSTTNINNNMKFINKCEIIGEMIFKKEKINDNSIISFDESDIFGVRFIKLPYEKVINNVKENYQVKITRCQWAFKRFLRFFKIRRIIEDEKYISGELDLIKLYRSLHNRFYNSSEFRLSSDFYVGFMIANRNLQKKGVSKAIDSIYYFFSKYGESIKRPLFTLIAMWLIIPIILLQLGINIGSENTDLTKVIWDMEGDIFFLTTEYWKTFLLNISLSTFLRSNDLRPTIINWQYFILFIETIINGILLGFLALGIRRTFAPKKPI